VIAKIWNLLLNGSSMRKTCLGGQLQ
jgi:hypothetical protein